MAVSAPRTNLNDQVYEELKRRLVRRELGPGEKVSLHELAAELGVSRSPVHHALTRLVSEGLLTVKSRRGYYVQALTARALDEGYAVRLALELHAADVAVGRASAGQLARFRSLLETTTDAVSHAEWDAANAAFHEHQVDLAGNALLSRFYRDLSVNLMMQVIRGGGLEGGAYLVEEHEAIVAAFEAGDAAAAKRAIAAHIATGKRIALAALEEAGGVL
ncbi:MAG TPA: GntR family transcriptional regulator [Gaiellaceae bacterium]|nr:GntR family transcriptional regulator [Gaiellaceae bacterium]